jgi:6-phosphogluconolactonase (cycloisomerase 2 family)
MESKESPVTLKAISTTTTNSIILMTLSPSFKIVAKIEKAHEQEIKFTKVIQFNGDNFLISGGYDKLIKLWTIDPSTYQLKQVKQWRGNKKVTHVEYDEKDNILYFVDKHGGIYAIYEAAKFDKETAPEMVSQNLDTNVTF